MASATETRLAPKLPRMEARHEATDRAARTIIDSEVALRDAKTERLRAERLAREVSGVAIRPPEKKPQERRATIKRVRAS